ncbi:M28 family peptidase [Aliifodinibius sp. S!AR15-10]|uniref:M28 family peptidase n=1 Tax=Aliifodinibius sp. S!AR15-10 TaxID=2950437 RepID=UPI00285FE2F1|nr:M28 family peptidase [Aliifodinibius sp. S!AR15-10]MDR8389645.1 M28 family peptidase [Aliifodinibius sp. S!AR15-10]
MKTDPQRLRKHVATLCNELGPRDAGHPENMDRVATYIQNQFELYVETAQQQPYSVDGFRVRNVRAFMGPDTKEQIVVGAHYDVAGPYPGADDNASGVAGLLELARLLSDDELTLKVELVAYPLEEPPYFYTRKMGSFVHAKSLKDQNINVRAMLALEMIGYFKDDEGSQSYPLFLLRPFYPSVGNYIAVVGKLFQRKLVRSAREAMRRATPLPVESINAPRLLPGIALSDHLNYWWAGYPAAMITDTAFYRNPHYHTAHDTPDTLDYERMAQVVNGVRAAVIELSR